MENEQKLIKLAAFLCTGAAEEKELLLCVKTKGNFYFKTSQILNFICNLIN